jgi:hypothetical protein
MRGSFVKPERALEHSINHRNPTSRSRIVFFSEEKSFQLLLYPKTGFISCDGHVQGDQISL